jgi:hypothetical protein
MNINWYEPGRLCPDHRIDIRQLLDFARRTPGQRVPVNVRGLVGQALDLMVPLAQKQAVDLCILTASY